MPRTTLKMIRQKVLEQAVMIAKAAKNPPFQVEQQVAASIRRSALSCYLAVYQRHLTVKLLSTLILAVGLVVLGSFIRSRLVKVTEAMGLIGLAAQLLIVHSIEAFVTPAAS